MGIQTSVRREWSAGSLSLEEQVGQLFLMGFDGREVSPHVRTLIQERGVGSLIVFERNAGSPEENADLTHALQQLAAEAGRPPLLIAADQEGGWVVRLTEGNTRFPGNMAQGATRSPELAQEVAACIARELLAQGVNFNLAPVLDVNNNPENPIIGLRSFGASPTLVAQMGDGAIEGYQSHGVAACAKHFPGHGDTDTDSHLDLPVIAHERARLDSLELVPFKRAIAAGVWCMMTAHIVFRSVVGDLNTPGSLSKDVTRILREELGFNGVIVTDCMEMHAVAKRYSFAESAVQAVAAGADLITISHTAESQIEALDAVTEAVADGRISTERINEACERVLRLKERVGAHPGGVPRLEEVGGSRHLSVAQSVADEAVTLVRNPGKAVPLSRAKELLVIDVSSAGRWRGPGDPPPGTQLQEELRRQGFRVKGVDHRERKTLTPDARDQIVAAAARGAQALVVVQRVIPELIAAVAAALGTATPVVAVAVADPYAHMKVPDAWSVLVTYGQEPVLLATAARILSGDLPPRGKLPV